MGNCVGTVSLEQLTAFGGSTCDAYTFGDRVVEGFLGGGSEDFWQELKE